MNFACCWVFEPCVGAHVLVFACGFDFPGVVTLGHLFTGVFGVLLFESCFSFVLWVWTLILLRFEVFG